MRIRYHCICIYINPRSQLHLGMSEKGTDLSPLTFIWGHLTASLPEPSFDYTGRTVLVTGGNAG